MKSGSWFVIEMLMSVVVIGVLFIGVMVEVVMVLLLFFIGECLEGWVVSCVCKGVSVLMVFKLEMVICLCDGVWEEVVINILWLGDIIEVVVGGCLFVDGKLVFGFVSFDESVFIGEFILVECVMGDKVLVGVISVDCFVILEVLFESGVSVIDCILMLIEEVEECCVFIEWFIDCFSCIYMLVIMVIVLLVMFILLLMFDGGW